jgi:predicted ATPase
MYVESLRISGFTSFKDVTWKPERLNVLIGPNGSGKSNLLRALELIRASAAGNLRDFVLGKGGLPRLLWGGSARRMEFDVKIGPPSCLYNSISCRYPNPRAFGLPARSLRSEKEQRRRFRSSSATAMSWWLSKVTIALR